MSDIMDKNTFASLYSSQAPWDIGRPKKVFLDIADQITGSSSTLGCGTGYLFTVHGTYGEWQDWP